MLKNESNKSIEMIIKSLKERYLENKMILSNNVTLSLYDNCQITKMIAENDRIVEMIQELQDNNQ